MLVFSSSCFETRRIALSLRAAANFCSPFIPQDGFISNPETLLVMVMRSSNSLPLPLPLHHRLY